MGRAGIGKSSKRDRSKLSRKDQAILAYLHDMNRVRELVANQSQDQEIIGWVDRCIAKMEEFRDTKSDIAW